MTEDDLAAQLRDDIASILGETDLGVDDDLPALGLDSIRLMVLVERWRGAGVDLTLLDALAAPTARGFAQAALRAAGAPRPGSGL
jgi:aryl carrier-like protein